MGGVGAESDLVSGGAVVRARRRLLRLESVARSLIVGVLPAGLLVLGVVRYMLDHFFVKAPFLLDTGMLSWLAYRDGILLRAPRIALDYVEYYYDVYFSPLTSVFSLVSYVVPVGRIEWYVMVQAAVYAPFGFAVHLATPRLEPGTALRRLPVSLAAALAFSFCGPVLWMIGYPHLEAAMPGFICLMLGAVVTGRVRWAWVWLGLAASVRQDGGIHAATALAPLLFLQVRGVAMLASRRTLVAMIAVAVGLSALAMVAIDVFFHPFPRLAQAYLGTPLYSHLSVALLAERARGFAAHCQLIYYPLLATALVAALRRDHRYLLGWISTVPWFAFCFLAVEPVKAQFFAYGVGPFVVGMFWCYLYGAHLAPASRRLRAAALEAGFAIVCASSMLGAFRALPSELSAITHGMMVSHRRDRAAVYALVAAIRDHHAALGRLRVDGAVAALAMEVLDPSEAWYRGVTDVDTIAFHRASLEVNPVIADLVANQLDVCTRVRGTGIAVCARDRLPAEIFAGMATEVVPAALVQISSAGTPDSVRFEDRGVVVPGARALEGRLHSLPPGSYEWTIQIAVDGPGPVARAELATFEVFEASVPVASAAVANDARGLVLRFQVSTGSGPVSFRFESRASTALVITTMRLHRVAAR